MFILGNHVAAKVAELKTYDTVANGKSELLTAKTNLLMKFRLKNLLVIFLYFKNYQITGQAIEGIAKQSKAEEKI